MVVLALELVPFNSCCEALSASLFSAGREMAVQEEKTEMMDGKRSYLTLMKTFTLKI